MFCQTHTLTHTFSQRPIWGGDFPRLWWMALHPFHSKVVGVFVRSVCVCSKFIWPTFLCRFFRENCTNFKRLILRPRPLFSATCIHWTHIHNCRPCHRFYTGSVLRRSVVVIVVVCSSTAGKVLFCNCFVERFSANNKPNKYKNINKQSTTKSCHFSFSHVQLSCKVINRFSSIFSNTHKCSKMQKENPNSNNSSSREERVKGDKRDGKW